VGDEWAISVNAPGIQNELKEYLKYDILIPLK
jgi:hypothetical protein